jgi:hypothetical protein
MADDVKRMRYYNGLFLKEEEFELEQDYNVRMRRMHNARLHGKGIVWGLEVELSPVADNVLIKQGMALDYYFDTVHSEYTSREIVVAQDKPVDLSEYAGGQEIWLWITYDEVPAGDDPERGEFPFNTVETFKVEHSTTRPADEDLNIVLARIVVKPDDTIDENSIFYDEAGTGLPIRTGAGFAGPRVETDMLTLRAPTIAAPWAYMTGNEFQPGTPQSEVGINVVSERTRFLGAVDVDTDVTVENDLTVRQNAQVDGTLGVTGAVTLQQNLAVNGVVRSGNASGALEIDDDVHVVGNLSLLSGPAVSEISTDGTLADNSNTALPTEQAVRTFVESKIIEFVNTELVGSVVAFAMDTPPTGWLECDGAEVSRATYGQLFSRIGESYGAGDGSTTFRLPDLRGEFVRGWDHGAGVDVDAATRADRGDGTTGDAVGTRQLDQMQGHKHDDSGHTHGYTEQMPEVIGGPAIGVQSGAGLYRYTYSNSTSGASANLGGPVEMSNGSPRSGDETRSRNVTLMYCIKH